jgi:hypothetical protein
MTYQVLATSNPAQTIPRQAAQVFSMFKLIMV